MYSLTTIFTGITLAIMVAINGGLSDHYGVFVSSVVIHIVGVVFAFLACLIRKEQILVRERVPKWFYLGGVIGVCTTVFQNMAFAYISMTSIIALGLLGQALTSVLIDSLGLFGMKKVPVKKSSLIGFGFALLGIGMMLDTSVFSSGMAILGSIGAGVSVVISRAVNARLAEKTSPLQGSFINQLMGLPVCAVVAWIATGEVLSGSICIDRPWIYLGGVLGVLVVMLCNITVPKVPAFRLTVLTFAGQMFTSILIDMILGKGFSDASFRGGIVIAAGMLISMVAEQYEEQKILKEQQYWESIQKTEEAHRRNLIEKYNE